MDSCHIHMTESYSQRRDREKGKIQRMKQIKNIVRSAESPLSLNEIKLQFPKESERTIERDLSELVELENISYDKSEKKYWISNADLLQATEEQMKAISKITFEELSPVITNVVQLVKRLDPKNLGKMSDKRALSYMLERVNNEILKSPKERKK